MILVVPAVEKKRGGGHLSRCITLVKNLRASGCEAVLYLPPKTDTTFINNLIKKMEFNTAWIDNKNNLGHIKFIILDRYQTPLDEILIWKNIAPVIGIDEGGRFRDTFDFLIDILIPVNFIKPDANITSSSLLFNYDIKNKPIFTGSRYLQLKKILISFGHEDSAGLGLKTAMLLSKLNKNFQFEITLLRGALSSDDSVTEKQLVQLKQNNIKIMEAIPHLASHLSEYDLVITHYGITAYEAFYAGIPVLLDHPTPYHKKLAEAAGFFNIKKFSYIMNLNQDELSQINRKIHVNNSSDFWYNNKNLTELINSLSLIVNKFCPVCAAQKSKIIARFSDRTYRRCCSCKIIYMDRITEPPIEYDKDYFFDSYLKQYGKTYLEDFENIKNQAKRRLKIIKSINKKFVSKSLLDIGCAYGPFLAAAKEEGYSPYGIDPAQDAVSYVKEKLGIPAIHGFFPIPHSELNIPHSYNVITMWYVIEHFKDCVNAFKEIKKLLNQNDAPGVFAFSTPSFSGISARASFSRFLEASPADHFTVWSPKMCRKALAVYGFKVKKIVVIGHHPERFPLIGKFANNRNNFMYKILMIISRIFKLGDTFEVYAQAAFPL